MSLCEFKPQPQLYFQGTHIQIGRWVSLIFRTISLFCRSFKCNWTNIIINKLTSLNLWQESFLGNNWKYENGESKSGCPSVWALNYLTLWVTVTQLWFPFWTMAREVFLIGDNNGTHHFGTTPFFVPCIVHAIGFHASCY